MKKRLLSFICVLAVLLSFATVFSLGAEASGGVSIAMSVLGQTETEVTVDVSITGNVGFGYLELTPVYPEALSFTGVTNGNLISDFTQGNQYVWVADSDVTATGTLCTLNFAISEGTADGEYPISFTVQFCGNYNEEEVAVTVTPCNVTVGGEIEPVADASVISYQATEGGDGTFSLRLISVLNSLEYSCFGYEITVTTKDESGNDVTETLSGADNKAYSSIYGGNTAYSIKECFGYEYACLATLKGLSVDSEYTKLHISTYVVLSGEKLYGKSATLLYTGTADVNGYPVLTFKAE